MAKNPLIRNGDPTPLAVIDEYETLPGASNALYVLAEDDAEYVIKGPSLAPSNPTVGGNEWVAARLAEALGMPILDHRILQRGAEFFFGSVYLQKGKITPEITPEWLDRCENPDLIYDIVAFDVWLINGDRHHENLIVRHLKRPEVRDQLFPNDHSHLMVNETAPKAMPELMGWIDKPAAGFVWLSILKERITDSKKLGAAISRVEELPESLIRQIVASTPSPLLATSDRTVYADFLIQRQRRVRAVLQTDRRIFPNLRGSL
jgi:hypothetical protein